MIYWKEKNTGMVHIGEESRRMRRRGNWGLLVYPLSYYYNMRLKQLLSYLDSSKNYLITSSGDLRYIFGSNYIHDVELLVKNGAGYALGNALNVEELRRFLPADVIVCNTGDEAELNQLYANVATLVIDGDDISVSRQEKLRTLGVKNFSV